MELYFGMELPQKVIDCFLSVPKEQFGFHKDTNFTVEEIIEYIKQACLAGKIYIVYDREVILLFTDQTPYVLRMDSLRGENSTIFDYIKVINKVVKLFTEKTVIHKIETRTPFTDLAILAKRYKWKHEGTHEESYQMPDGSFVNELSFGLILHRSLEQKRKAEDNMNANLTKIMRGEY